MSEQRTIDVDDPKVKAINHESYGTFTLIAFILPIVGLILGIAYMTKDTKVDRKLGEHLIAISVLFAIVQGAAYYFFIFNAAGTPVVVNYQ